MHKNKKMRIVQILKNHVMQNYREYVIIMIFFVIGIFLGVFFINQIQEESKAEINQYLGNFMEELKNTSDINQFEVLKSSLSDKLCITIAIWFFGTTVVGIPIVFGLVVYRGFCLGYTISAAISFMGFTKGFLFVLITLFVQNLILIPALIGLAVSGFKFYKSIIKDRRKENIKISFLRHTVFSLFMFGGLCIASLMETFISTNLLKMFVIYF